MTKKSTLPRGESSPEKMIKRVRLMIENIERKLAPRSIQKTRRVRPPPGQVKVNAIANMMRSQPEFIRLRNDASNNVDEVKQMSSQEPTTSSRPVNPEFVDQMISKIAKQSNIPAADVSLSICDTSGIPNNVDKCFQGLDAITEEEAVKLFSESEKPSAMPSMVRKTKKVVKFADDLTWKENELLKQKVCELQDKYDEALCELKEIKKRAESKLCEMCENCLLLEEK